MKEEQVFTKKTSGQLLYSNQDKLGKIKIKERICKRKSIKIINI
jgi:hypothetical protein